jgi:ABC-2 type transport system ATP-binding protein
MTTALSIRSLKKVYSNGFEALKGIDLDVKEGDFFALLGPNGAGKSTTISVICSLALKSAGSIHIFDHDIDVDFSAAKKCIGIVPQEFNFNQFEKVFDIVANQGGYFGLPRNISETRAEKYLKQLSLWDKRNDISRSLSGGMKRRLMIARALVHEPKLLILDEPTAGVDIELRRSMWKFLKEINAQGTTIILTTHYLEEAESLCRNIAIIDGGEIVESTSMKSLLQRLDKETLIFDLKNELQISPVLKNCDSTLIDNLTLEVVVKKGTSLNYVFECLNENNIQVTSMRNKSNRLEELFLSLVQNDKG